MKKFMALVLTMVCVFGLVGCQKPQLERTGKSSNPITPNTTVLKAWSGEFSEEELKSAINEYQKNYTIIALEKNGKSSISFEADFEVSSCSVTRLSLVDDTNIEVELDSYIDLWIETNCDGRTVTIPINWWYAGDDSWVNDYFIWSYLVRVKDTNGSNHYYYFRVDYSLYAE